MKKLNMFKELKNHQKMGMWKRIVLALPILISLSLILTMSHQSQTATSNEVELLASADVTPLMVSLIIFTIGYIIFLLLMFSEEIKVFFKKEVKH